MEELFLKSNRIISAQALNFQRSLYGKIDWANRLIGILGARGTGKTTLLLQRLKTIGVSGGSVLYVSLDDVYFTRHSLVAVAEEFRASGGKYLFMDEVHKYPDWHREIKNIYDFNPELSIVFTGSSIIDMLGLPVDLSRRAMMYDLPGLSFREFLHYDTGFYHSNISFEELVTDHEQIAADILTAILPLASFPDYLAHGYYPFFKENIASYSSRLEQVVRLVIEYDLAFVEQVDHQNIRKILTLLGILAEHVPFTPNIADLSRKLGMARNTVVQYLNYLDKARLINNFFVSGKGLGKLEKPGKILLENPNLFEALALFHAEKGSIRESFFAGQLRNAGHHISLPTKGDFLIDEKYTVEVGGKRKGFGQISGVPDSFIAADEVEIGVKNKIPLWLFGFLY